MNNYKLPWHVRQYVKQELMCFEENLKMLKRLERYEGSEALTSTRSIILKGRRLAQIEKIFSGLSDEDREAAELIFIEKCSQQAAEIRGLSKGAYYNVMNKVIWLTAREMELI